MPCIIGVGLASYVMECFVFLLEVLMQETYVRLRAVALAPILPPIVQWTPNRIVYGFFFERENSLMPSCIFK